MFYMKIKTVKIMNCLCAEVTYLFWNEVKLIASIGHISIIRSFEGISAKNLFSRRKLQANHMQLSPLACLILLYLTLDKSCGKNTMKNQHFNIAQN